MDFVRPKEGVRYDLDITQLGREVGPGAKPLEATPSITRSRRGVIVSGEYVQEGDNQRKPVEHVYRDTKQSPSAPPIAEKRFGYAQLPDGKVALQRVEQVSRVPHGLDVRQTVVRLFREDGTVEGDQLLVFDGEGKGQVSRERSYGMPVNGRVDTIIDNHYNGVDEVIERVLYTRSEEDGLWHSQKMRFDSRGEEVKERVLIVPGKQPPGIVGVATGLPFIKAPKLPTWTPPEKVEDWTNMG